MERYDSYRPSEIPCLVSVPSHWKPSKFKFHHFEEDDTVGEYSDEYPLLSLTKKGVVFRDVESGKGKFPASFENYKVVHPDRLIFCLFDIDETPRTIGLSNHFGMITGAYKLFRTTPDLNPKFSLYTFLVIDNVKGLKPYYTGLRKVVRPETFKSLEFTLPPLHEQEQIVEYLDRKTTLIDSLIEKTVRKIELLKEKRASLINEVVTKGLNPDVEMKDSGVEWIGDVPSVWTIRKLKRDFSIEKKISGELEYDVLSVTQKGLRVKDLDDYTGQHSMDYSKYQIVEQGDFVMNHMDLLTGYVDLSVQQGVTSPDYRVFRSQTEEVYDPYFLYIFQMCYHRRIFYGLGRGVSNLGRWRLPSAEFLEFKLLIPPLHEQEQIVEYLDEQTSIIDSNITTEERRIELLKEYRQSLISEVVTGKVKVTSDE